MISRLLGGVGLLRAPPSAWFSQPEGHTPHGVALTYLGTAGFVLEAEGRTIVLDPYLSRPGLRKLLTRRLVCDEKLLARHVPHADDVFVGHAHFDHVLDAPAICLRTGARLVGSRAVCMVARAAGVPEPQLRETAGREDIACGAVTVRGLPSLHGKVLFGRVPFPGDIDAPPAWPPRMRDLRHGLVLNWLVKVGDFSLVHVDSAELINTELQGHQADVVCLCAAGWRRRPDYVADVVRILKPRFVLVCHWDTMLTPISQPMQMIPGLELAALLHEVRDAGVKPLLLPQLGKWRF